MVTLALAYDIDALYERGKLIPKDWQKRLPNNSAPYTSTIVFLVRKGNPKGIKDWDDLVKPGVSVITPNPKTSGGARWNYLAAWGYALEEVRQRRGQGQGFRDAPLHATCRCWTPARAARRRPSCERGIGDVLHLVGERGLPGGEGAGAGQVRDRRALAVSILAEPPVTVVDKVVDKHGTRKAAQAYLEYLYSPRRAGDRRPALSTGRAWKRWRPSTRTSFRKVKLFTIDEVFGGWQKAQSDALRRRRHVRPDLPAWAMTIRIGDADEDNRSTHRPAIATAMSDAGTSAPASCPASA